jgi:hypothetical protein
VILEFFESQGPILDGIGGNCNGLTHNSDAASSIYRRNSVRVCKLWVLIEQQTSHSQVPGHHVGILGR